MSEQNQEFRFVNLYSSSEGNCTYIKTPDAEMLFDAGKCARKLENALRAVGADASRITDIFVTHEHIDHISALRVLMKRYGATLHSPGIPKALFKVEPNSYDNIVLHNSIFSVKIGNTTVTSFATSHDSLVSVGYRIEYHSGSVDRIFGLATDTGYVTEGVRDGLIGCEAVMLECNHDIDMLMNGDYPPELKARNRSNKGHLSNDDCATFSKELVASGTKYLMLAHLSSKNNTAEKAYGCVSSAIGESDVFLTVANKAEFTVLL